MKEGWEYKKFEDALQKVKYTRKIQNSDYLPNGVVPVVSQEETFISGYWNNKNDAFKVDSPVVIFGDHSRVVKYVDFDFVLGADGVKILKPIDGLNARFFYHFLKWYDVPSLGYSRHYKLLKEIDVPFPSLSEQQHIVEELDLLSSIIEKKKAQLNELDNLAQSLFYEMFGDPITNEKAWEVKKLESLLSNIKYGTGTPPQFSEQGFKFIRATNIKGGYIREDNMLYISPKEAAKIEKCKLQKNDMIVVRSGVNAGDVCRISEEYEGQYAGYDIIITINSVFANTVYLNLLMNNRDYVEEIIKPLTRRAAQPHLNAQQVKSFTIPLPPLVLQQQFASKIEAIEHQKELIKQSIKEVETLFNSRMDYYFN